MTGASVLATSPEELRRAATLLRGIGADLEGVGDRVLRGGALGDGWAGVAALEQQARTTALGALVRLSAAPGLEVAGALERCADVAEDAGARVRAGTRRIEHGLEELARLRALGPPPEPLLEQAWRRRLAEAEQEVETARRAVSQAEELFDEAQRRAAGVVERAWSVVQDPQSLWQVGAEVRRIASGLPKHVAHLVRTTDMVISLARARWAAGAQARAAALQRGTARLHQLWLQLRSPRRARQRFGTARFVPGPVGWVSAWFAAWSDARDGGGYAGWRGEVTRVLAGGALAGGPVALAGLHPALMPAAPVGLGLISVYQVWMLGNATWDTLPAVGRFARSAAGRLRVAGTAGVAMARRARDRAVARLRWVRSTVAGGGSSTADRLRRVTDEVVDRLPGTAPLRDRIRQVGVPIHLPGVPLGPVLRAPVDLGRWPGPGGTG